MKKTDLEKLKGLRLRPQAGAAGAQGQFGKQLPAAPGRREQRDIDRALGLVPFAVKLNGELIAQVQALAKSREIALNEVVAELLDKGLKSKAK